LKFRGPGGLFSRFLKSKTMSDTSNADTVNQAGSGAQGAAEACNTDTGAQQQGPSLAEQLESAKAEAAANKGHYLRAMADLENYRKRATREKEEVRQYGAARILEDLLPVLDNLGLGLAAAKQPNADLKTLTGGVEMVLSQLKAALAGHGLKEISPLGEAFDPHQHEAISHAPSDTVPAEHVLIVVRTGFSLNGRLLRPATVIVSGGPEAPKA
jgi:molecular chaperone GrpE